MSAPPANEYIDVSTIGIDTVEPTPSPLPTARPLQSYWLATSPSTLEGVTDGSAQVPAKSDVVIIGSGVTGASTAFHLAQTFPQNTRITILEARQFCSGATGRNGGHLSPASALAYTELAANPNHLARFSHLDSASSKRTATTTTTTTTTQGVVRKILEFEARTVEGILEVVRGKEDEVELVGGKNWHLCFQDAEVDEFEQSLAAAQDAGLTDFVGLVRRVPKHEFDQTMKSPRGIRAVYEIPGNTMHPRKLVQLIYRAARQRAEQRNIKLEAFAHCPVTAVEDVAGGEAIDGVYRLKVKVGEREVLARYVVHATNGYVSHLAPQLAGPTGVIPTRAQVVAVEPVNEAGTAEGATTTPAAAEGQGSTRQIDNERQGAAEAIDSGADGAPPTKMLWGMGISAGGGYEYGHQRPVLPSVVAERTGDEDAVVGDKLKRVRRPLFVFGGGREYADGREWGVADDGALNDTVSEFLHSWLPRIMPQDYEGSDVVLEWTGVMGYTKSKDPFVGPLPRHRRGAGNGAGGEPGAATMAGQFLSAGYSGHGMSRAFGCAEVVASMVVAEEKGEAWTPPQWFPLCYLSALPESQ